MTITAERVKMNNNSDNNPTYAQALKIYTGRSPLRSVVTSAGIAAAAFGFVVLYVGGLTLLMGEKHTNVDILELCLVMLSASALAAPRTLQTFTRSTPGGKFFRTVKGGFETFRKMRAAMLAETLLMIAVYYLLAAGAAALDLLPLKYGVMSCAAGAVNTVFAVGLGNICLCLKKGIVRITTATLTMMIAAVLSVPITESFSAGSLRTVFIIMIVTDAVLIPLSHRIMINDYRKNHWDN